MFQVVYGVGLCIILFDVTFVGDPYVIHGTGASHTRGMYVTSSVYIVDSDTTIYLDIKSLYVT